MECENVGHDTSKGSLSHVLHAAVDFPQRRCVMCILYTCDDSCILVYRCYTPLAFSLSNQIASVPDLTVSFCAHPLASRSTARSGYNPEDCDGPPLSQATAPQSLQSPVAGRRSDPPARPPSRRLYARLPAPAVAPGELFVDEGGAAGD